MKAQEEAYLYSMALHLDFQIINLFILADSTKNRWDVPDNLSVTVLDNLCRRPNSCPRESPTELVSNKWSPGW